MITILSCSYYTQVSINITHGCLQGCKVVAWNYCFIIWNSHLNYGLTISLWFKKSKININNKQIVKELLIEIYMHV